MAKEKILQHENFILGMRRDGALSQEATRDEQAGGTPYILHSLKTLENYDIDFVDGWANYQRWLREIQYHCAIR